jgi:hypothetical protein
MAEDKKSIVLYTDMIHTFEAITDEEAGLLIKHIFRYVNDTNPEPPNRIIQIMFEPIKQQLKRDLVKWERIRKTRTEIGRLGGLKSGESRKLKLNDVEANATKTKQNEANEPVNVNVNVNVINDNNIPTETEFLDFCKTLPINFEQYKFSLISKYEQWKSDGWRDGYKKKIVNWKVKLKNTIQHLKPMSINQTINKQRNQLI